MWQKQALFLLSKENEDSNILSLLFTTLLPSAVHRKEHFIDYSVQTEAVQLLLCSKKISQEIDCQSLVHP